MLSMILFLTLCASDAEAGDSRRLERPRRSHATEVHRPVRRPAPQVREVHHHYRGCGHQIAAHATFRARVRGQAAFEIRNGHVVWFRVGVSSGYPPPAVYHRPRRGPIVIEERERVVVVRDDQLVSELRADNWRLRRELDEERALTRTLYAELGRTQNALVSAQRELIEAEREKARLAASNATLKKDHEILYGMIVGLETKVEAEQARVRLLESVIDKVERGVYDIEDDGKLVVTEVNS